MKHFQTNFFNFNYIEYIISCFHDNCMHEIKIDIVFKKNYFISNMYDRLSNTTFDYVFRVGQA